MFGRVEGGKPIKNDNTWKLEAQNAIPKEDFVFETSMLGVGDEFTVTILQTKVTPKGTNDEEVLKQAPDPTVEIAGVKQKARIVVDLSKNYLYTYDENGKPLMAYLIASGKPETPTHKGVRRIDHFEEHPYLSATNSKRKRIPDAFGPRVMYLETIDTKTGKSLGSDGEFIHGNNDEFSLGKYESGGCIRMDNDVVQELVDSGQIPAGSYVLIQ